MAVLALFKSSWVFWAAIGLFAAAALISTSRPKQKLGKALPGPKGPPLVGAALQIPKSHSWLKFAEWAKEYGPIYQVQAFGTTLIIISKESVANDLLGLRGAIYSDRPSLIMQRLVSDNGFLGAMAWSDGWRRARKFTQAMLSTANNATTVPKQTAEARRTVVDMFKEPAKYPYLLERAGVMTSLKQIYGRTEASHADEEAHVHEIGSYMETIERVAIPGAYLVEFIPILEYLPTWLASFKREAAGLAKKHWDYHASLVPSESAYEESNSSRTGPTFVSYFYNNSSDWKLSNREVVWALSSIYGGAAGTSSSAMQSIILNLCLYPEWQKKIQAELDQHLSSDALPTIENSSDIPTIRAVIKETMRWRPVLPGGFPHASTKDDVYQGYHIPQGAVIIPNQWAILRDEDQYPQGDKFKPERWLESGWPTYKEPLTEFPNLKRFAAFGHGRRVCPGLEVAENAIFLGVATLYWACHVSPANGVASLPAYDYTGATISIPQHFEFKMEERGSGRIERLRLAAEASGAR